MAKSVRFNIEWLEYDSADDLYTEDRELVMHAMDATEKAYAPYSNFKVGAAVRLENGEVVTGSNIENAAFPSGTCAERNVLITSASCFPGIKPVTLAIAARTDEGITAEPVPPCGNCRQVIAEEENRNKHPLRIIMAGRSKVIIVEQGGYLLPLQFNVKTLRQGSP